MKKTLVTVLVALVFSALSAEVSAASNDDVKKCLKTKGATWVDQCYCPNDFQFNRGTGECEPAKCEDVKPPAPAPTVTRPTPRRSAPEEAPPACVSSIGDRYVAGSTDEEIAIEVTCDPGNRPITLVTAEGEGLKVGDKNGKGFSPMSIRKQKGKKGPVTETFKVRPLDANNPGAGKLTVFSKGKREESPRTEVSIMWPAKKVPVVEPPPPPPPPPVDPNKEACERDGGKYDPLGIPSCKCPEGSEPGLWHDKNGNLHMCKLRPVVGPAGAPGKTTVIKEIIAKGDASHMLFEAGYLGLGVNNSFAGGASLTIGFSWGFAQPVSKWHLTVRGGLLYMPTPRYSAAGTVARDASGNETRDWAGFMASASVSYTFHPNFALGIGPDYIALGYRVTGRTYEFIGARFDLAFYPVRTEYLTLEVALTPRVGRLVGGGAHDGATSAGGEVRVGLLF